MIKRTIKKKLFFDELKSNKSDIWIAFAYTILLFFKCILFVSIINPEVIGFNSNLITPYCIRIVLINLFFCGLIASCSLLNSNKRWTIIVAFILDIWLIGNLLYFRSYNDLLNSWSLINISNMNGIWNSILPFMAWQDIVFPLSTVVWIIVIKKRLPTSLHNFKLFVTSVLITSIGFLPTAYMSHRVKQPINPFNHYFQEASTGRIWYTTTFSPIAHLINESKTLVLQFISKPTIPNIQKQDLEPFVNTNKEATSRKQNLLIIFFESLESWSINTSIDGQAITPNINQLIQDKSTTYFPKVVPQVRNGMSSDAQLIVNTGLLPIYDGAVSMRFYANKFPSLADALQSHDRKMFIPTPSSAWNQEQMTRAYHYNSLFAKPISDNQMMTIVSKELRVSKSSFCFFVTTMASHSPFTAYADSSHLQFTSPLPSNLKNYIKSVNYTDQCIGNLLKELLKDSLLKTNTTIVITGDHTIFDAEKRKEYINLLRHPSTDSEPQPFVPLIIYSTSRNSSRTQNDTIYQMDIYPTLLNVMHCENYVWKGFGRNVFYETSKKRPISPEKANSLSDKLIRNNYFEGLLKN